MLVSDVQQSDSVTYVIYKFSLYIYIHTHTHIMYVVYSVMCVFFPIIGYFKILDIIPVLYSRSFLFIYFI